MSDLHWSYSRISKFLRCPLAYFFEYELEIPKRFVPSNMVLGSAVHEALATYHRSIRDGTPCDRETVLDNFVKSWKQREAKEKVQFSNGELKDDLLEEGGNIIRAYLDQPPPTEVIAVEESFYSTLVTSDGGVLDRPLISVLDLLTREPSGLTITDFKTAGRSMSAAEADMSLQANCYVNAVRQNFGEQVTFKFTVLVKTKTPKVQHVEVNRTAADLDRLGDIVQSIERAVQAEVFYPIETPLNCSTCPYRRPCRDWPAHDRETDLISTIPLMERASTC